MASKWKIGIHQKLPMVAVQATQRSVNNHGQRAARRSRQSPEHGDRINLFLACRKSLLGKGISIPVVQNHREILRIDANSLHGISLSCELVEARGHTLFEIANPA